MHNLAELDEKSTDKIPRSLMGLGLRTYADRIEAAEKRENVQIGCAPAMRKALVWLSETGFRSPEGGWMCITLKRVQKDGKPCSIEVPPYAEDVINAALAKPPRNCDVGTVEEQHQRFIDYCNACDCPMGCIYRKEFVGMLDTRCASMLKCYIRWAQMPYKEGNAE